MSTFISEPGTRLAGRYRLEDRVSDTAGSTLWKAIDETLARPVAVLTFAPGFPRVYHVVTAARAASRMTDSRLAQVFDVDPFDQEKGGAPTEMLIAAKTPFKNDWPQGFVTNNLFVTIFISGMMGPMNMTYQQIINRWGPTYNPIDHLRDVDPATRTVWYTQIIPFIGMTVY